MIRRMSKKGETSNVMLYKCYKQVMGYLESHFDLLIRFCCGMTKSNSFAFQIPCGFKHVWIVGDELQLLSIRFRVKFLHSITIIFDSVTKAQKKLLARTTIRFIQIRPIGVNK